jgi:hypothetical protein
MKYLAAFVIGVGLIAHNPVSAENIEFGIITDAPLEDCVKASRIGVSLGGTKGETDKRFLVNKGEWGPFWKPHEIWRIYEMRMSGSVMSFEIECFVRGEFKR